MQEMYRGVVNSPETTITNDISNTDTLIYVLDETRIPEELPNLMTLGTGTGAETIKVLSISGNALTVERGFQGVAKAWNAGTVIARNFTEYDYEALRQNVGKLDNEKVDKVTGKGLSTEDFTAAEKIKLAGIATGATKTTIINDLTSTSATQALSANQGRILNNNNLDLAGTGRTTETVKGNADDIGNLAGTGRTTETVKGNADDIVNLAGTGRTTETVKGNADTIATKAETVTHTATITTTDWNEIDDHYEQEIEVVGMLDTDNPIADILLAGAADYDEVEAMLEAWGNIYRIATDDDAIIVYSTDETEVEIEIQIKVVK